MIQYLLFNPPFGKKYKGGKKKKGHAYKKSGGKKRMTFLDQIRKMKKASEYRSPRGGRKVGNNRGGHPVMARRKGRRGRKGGFRLFGLNPISSLGSLTHAKLPKQSGYMSGLKPKNMIGVIPVIAGVIANSMLSSAVSSRVGFTKKGIGNYGLGLIGAGVVGGVGALISKEVAFGAALGGVVETLGRLVNDLRTEGLSALSLKGDESFENSRNTYFGSGGMGDFVTPGQIQQAFPSAGTISQYSLPDANAVPAGIVQPQHPQAAAHAQKQHEEAHQNHMIAEMIDDNGGF